MYSLSLASFAFCTLFVLASCGGGGSPALPINPEIPQGTPSEVLPTESASEAASRAADIRSQADSILMTTAHYQSSIPQRSFVASASCSGRSCTFLNPFTGSVLQLDIEDFSRDASSSDQPVLTEQGITLFEGEEPERQNHLYGVLEDSFFDSFTFVITSPDEVIKYRGALAFGDRTRSRPSSSGIWRGQLSAVTQSSSEFLQGDAMLTYTVSDTQGLLDAVFSEITNLSRSAPHSITEVRFSNVEVTSSGSFSQGDQGNSIQGAFYGINAAEIAGTFERSGILGAFGAQL